MLITKLGNGVYQIFMPLFGYITGRGNDQEIIRTKTMCRARMLSRLAGGIGNAFNMAVRGQNYPLVMMIALFSVFAVLFASLLVDILTAALDPRVKLH